MASPCGTRGKTHPSPNLSPEDNHFWGEEYYLAGREGFEPSVRLKPLHSLSRRARSATPAPPHMQLPLPPCIASGGRGIRTHGDFRHTCFQDRRLKPLGHPSIGARIVSYNPQPDKTPKAPGSPRRNPTPQYSTAASAMRGQAPNCTGRGGQRQHGSGKTTGWTAGHWQ